MNIGDTVVVFGGEQAFVIAKTRDAEASLLVLRHIPAGTVEVVLEELCEPWFGSKGCAGCAFSSTVEEDLYCGLELLNGLAPGERGCKGFQLHTYCGVLREEKKPGGAERCGQEGKYWEKKA